VTPLRQAQLGGAQAFLCDLAAGFAARGHDVTVHCAAGSDVPGLKLETVPLAEGAADPLLWPTRPPSKPSPAVSEAMKAMFGAINMGGADVISQHAFEPPAFEYSKGLPVLHTLHLPPIVPAVREVAGRVAPPQLATVSRSCQAEWLKAGIGVERVIASGVGIVPGPPAPTEPVALVAGRVTPEKGVEDAIAAARRAGLRVLVAGARLDHGYNPDLSGAEYLGFLPRDELRMLMARSAVTICAPRWDEPFSMVAAEAQVSGCPVAGYRRGALPEIVDDGIGGILAEPDDVSDLARAVRKCLDLDRARVRTSARLRLGLDAALDRYEAAFYTVAF